MNRFLDEGEFGFRHAGNNGRNVHGILSLPPQGISGWVPIVKVKDVRRPGVNRLCLESHD